MTAGNIAAIDQDNDRQQSVIIGFDPGRDKCGIAVMGLDQRLCWHQVVSSDTAIATLKTLCTQYPVSLLVLGNQTTSKQWQQRLQPLALEIVPVDERNSTLEARDRYWQLYPAHGWVRVLPKDLRTPPRPIDDIVAIILIERYLEQYSD
jgi:RNase H-fold protein (predicted Holliday junction resolvase)